MCCGRKLAKLILIVFNILFLIFGGLCLGIGIWVKLDQSSLIYLTRVSSSVTNLSALDLPSLIESASILLIAGGAAVFVIAFLGFCGALKQVKCCLYLYSTFVLLILLVEIAAAVMAIVFKSNFDSYAKTYLSASLTSKYVGPYTTSDAVSLAFDVAHIKLECCGINNATDFSSASNWNTTWTQPSTGSQFTANIPFTCCISSASASHPSDISAFITGMTNDNCPVSQTSSHTNGCYGALLSLFQTYLYVTLGVGIGVGTVEILGVICACFLACNADKNKVSGF